MSVVVSKIFLTNEFQTEAEIDYNNTDVIVQLDSEEKYIASFLTYQYLEDIREENLKSGSFLQGKYFWKKLMVLVENCEKQTIEKVVKHLIDEGEFEMVFEKLN